MDTRTRDQGSRNLLRGPGPFYHNALWSYAKEPIFRIHKDGTPESRWLGGEGIRVRNQFTIDDLISYYYDKFGVFSPEIRSVRRAADIGATLSLASKMSLDLILFAIDAMWEEHGLSKRIPSLIRASEYIEEAQEKLAHVEFKLCALLQPLWQERYERLEGGGADHVDR